MSDTRVIVVSNNTKKILQAATGAQLMRAAKMGAGVIETYAKLNASSGRPGLNVDTGNLVNSITVTETAQSETYAETATGTGVEYAAIHEFGGVIMPLHKKLLSWIGDDGKRIFAKMVHIPARPYMRPAVDEHMDDIEKAISTALAQQIGDAAK